LLCFIFYKNIYHFSAFHLKFVLNCLLLLLVGNSFLVKAQRISPDSVLRSSRLLAQSHSAQIRHIKFDVKIKERNRFTQFPELAQKRLERIEGIRAPVSYTHLTLPTNVP
jgi:hypothetical protein